MDSVDKSFKKSKKSVLISSARKPPAPGPGDSASTKKVKVKVLPVGVKKPDVPSAKKSSKKVCKSDDVPSAKKSAKKAFQSDDPEKIDRSQKTLKERKKSSSKCNDGSQKGKHPPVQIRTKKPEKQQQRGKHHQQEKEKEKDSDDEESGKGSLTGAVKGGSGKNKRKKDNGEINLVKESVAAQKNIAHAREENEISDVEAEQPRNKPEKPIMKRGGQLEIGENIYEIIDGSVVGDYGNCTVREAKKDELLTFRYESISSKCKRIKIECTVLVCAAATQKTHMLRLLLRGTIDNFKLRYLITDALGFSIPDLLSQLSIDSFSIASALRLSFETFESIEELHRINFVHRDVKPAAFAFGLKPFNSKLYLTHFGLARKFRSSADAKLLAPRKTVPFMGTVKYASRAAHERCERSRKDDIEAWVYMITEFVDEKALSWRRIANRDNIFKEKNSFMSDDGITRLYSKHKKIPEEFRPLIHYVMALEFSSSPDYLYIKKILREAMEKRTVSVNDPWEWDGLESEDDKKHKTCDSTQQQPED